MRAHADIGDPSSKASGRLFKGIAERLREAGFENVQTQAKAYGISASARGKGRPSQGAPAPPMVDVLDS